MNVRHVGLSVVMVALLVRSGLLVGSGLSRTATLVTHAQTALTTVDEHVKAAEAAAGQEYRPLFTQLCAAPAP